MTTLSERIKEAKESAGLSNADLARATGRSQGAVTQWLQGSVVSLKADTAAQIERATGYRASWLVTGKGPKKVEDIQPQPMWDVLTSLEILGRSIVEVVDPGARSSAVAMLTTYINDPIGNLDVLPLIAKRLSGERMGPDGTGFWDGKRNTEASPPAATSKLPAKKRSGEA